MNEEKEIKMEEKSKVENRLSSHLQGIIDTSNDLCDNLIGQTVLGVKRLRSLVKSQELLERNPEYYGHTKEKLREGWKSFLEDIGDFFGEVFRLGDSLKEMKKLEKVLDDLKEEKNDK